ncbi:hypothetical protein R1sor_026795 [Riccia sorocarpa]|uniref:RRM domain-containing protein n=1 Tax=Riccia sorocarpa TaxID=122646 RepID=A0ABD3GCD7_9MARC
MVSARSGKESMSIVVVDIDRCLLVPSLMVKGLLLSKFLDTLVQSVFPQSRSICVSVEILNMDFFLGGDTADSPRHRRSDRYSRSPSPRERPERSRSRSPPRRSPPPRERNDRSRSRSPVRRYRHDALNPGNNLYVTGLSTRVNEKDLEEHFSREGKVLECRLVLDPRTRESRGFGFVTMEHLEDAERCIKYLNRSTLEGRMITVEKNYDVPHFFADRQDLFFRQIIESQNCQADAAAAWPVASGATLNASLTITGSNSSLHPHSATSRINTR